MIGFRRAATLALAGAVASVVAGCHAPASRPDAEEAIGRYDATIDVLPGGSLHVDEVFVLGRSTAGGAPFPRRIPVDRFDSVDLITFSVDHGGRMPLASADRAGGLDVEVPVDTMHVATGVALAYRVNGAVAVRGGRGLLTWPVFPGGHPFAIDHAAITLRLPPTGMAWVSTPPAPADGWTVVPAADGWRLEGAHVPARSPVVVSAELAVDTNAVAEPDWQALETRTRQLMPAFVSAAFFILVTGGGIIFMIRWQFSSRTPAGAPRELDPAGAARGLVVAGWVLIVLGLAGALATWRWFTFFGQWPVTVPLSIAIVGAAFLPEAARVRRTAARA